MELFEDLLNDDTRLNDVESQIIMAQSGKRVLTALLGAPSAAVDKEFRWFADEEDDAPPKAYPDGHVHTTFNSVQPEALRGMCQEFRDDWGVGRQSKATGTHTRHNDPNYQKKRALDRLYKQIEITLGSSQEQRESVAAANGRDDPDAGSKLRGIITGLTPKPASGTDPQVYFPFPEQFRTRLGAYYTDTLANLTPEAFEEMLGVISEYRNEPVDLMGLMGLQLKTHFASWIQKDLQASGPWNVSVRRGDDKWKVDLTVDVFKFEAGTVRTALSYYLNYDLATGKKSDLSSVTGLIIDPKLFKVRRNFGLEHVPLDDRGQGSNGFYRTMIGLQTRLPCANGLIIPAA